MMTANGKANFTLGDRETAVRVGLRSFRGPIRAKRCVYDQTAPTHNWCVTFRVTGRSNNDVGSVFYTGTVTVGLIEEKGELKVEGGSYALRGRAG